MNRAHESKGRSEVMAALGGTVLGLKHEFCQFFPPNFFISVYYDLTELLYFFADLELLITSSLHLKANDTDDPDDEFP